MRGETQTFPVFVWGIARVSVPPQVNVLASAIFLIAIGIALGNVLWEYRARSENRESPDPARPDRLDLQQPAKEHLWMHFTRMGGYAQSGRADHRARRRLLPRGHERQALPRRAGGLFSVNIGYSFGEEMGQAALEQMRELGLAPHQSMQTRSSRSKPPEGQQSR